MTRRARHLRLSNHVPLDREIIRWQQSQSQLACVLIALSGFLFSF